MRHESNHEKLDSLAPVLAEYLTRIDQGAEISRATFLTEHPAHAEELQAYYADVDAIERLALSSGVAATPGANAGLSRSGKEEGATTPRDFGDYELLGELGRGGMGIVYRARERSTGRHVALKMLLHGRFMSSAEVSRFRNETRTAAALQHRGIVPIYHVGEHHGQSFYTMPIIEGRRTAK